MPTTTKAHLIIAFFDGYGEGITPTANFTAQTGYPLSNMGLSRLFDRTLGPLASMTDLTITWDLGAAIETNIAAIVSTNLTSAATMRYRQATDSGFTANVAQSGAAMAAAFDSSLGTLVSWTQPAGRPLIYVLPTSSSARYFRWQVTDAANANNYLAFGPARFGMGYQYEYGFASGGWRTRDRYVGSLGAQIVQRTHEITIGFASKAEAYKTAQMLRYIKENRRVLVIPEALNTDTYQSDAIWCTVEGAYDRGVVVGGSERRYELTVVFVEVDW